jgi:hypothetical protein
MSSFDPTTLPAPLGRYFDTVDHSQVAPLFSADAQVHDEGAWHRGKEAIAGWLSRVEEKYHPRYVVEGAHTEAGRIIVTFKVSGTFPGSPARLQQAFTLGPDNLIARLETL